MAETRAKASRWFDLQPFMAPSRVSDAAWRSKHHQLAISPTLLCNIGLDRTLALPDRSGTLGDACLVLGVKACSISGKRSVLIV